MLKKHKTIYRYNIEQLNLGNINKQWIVLLQLCEIVIYNITQKQ